MKASCSTKPIARSCRRFPSAARRRPGRPRRAGSPPPTSPCRWRCRNSTAASPPVPSRSRRRSLPIRRSPSRAGVQAPDAGGIDAVADQAAAWMRLARTPRRERRLALVLSDYPARGGRAGFAVGLDTPASACAILDCLARSRLRRADGTSTADELMPRLTEGEAVLRGAARPPTRHGSTRCRQSSAPPSTSAWGAARGRSCLRDGAFRFRAIRAGKHPRRAAARPRSRRSTARRFYHDPERAAEPRLSRLLSRPARAASASTRWSISAPMARPSGCPARRWRCPPTCWPRLAIGALPVIYPFIVDDPGEAAPAKRRHRRRHHRPPARRRSRRPACTARPRALRELVEEYSSAQVLDPAPGRTRRAARSWSGREASGLAAACGVDDAMPMDEALTAPRRASLRSRRGDDPRRAARLRRGARRLRGAARAGRARGLAARPRRPLRRARPGRLALARAPDVLPTGRNLATLDPRAIPTRAATELGARAAAEVVRRHLQDEGDYPRRIVMDLWASPTLRSGGEDIAHALALMGVRPTWDHASTRVTGFEIVPQPLLDRPRIDVTMRVSGAFRDTFPDQIALLDRPPAPSPPSTRTMSGTSSPPPAGAARPCRASSAPRPAAMARACRRRRSTATGTTRGDLGRAYLDGTSHAFGAARRRRTPMRASRSASSRPTPSCM